ncbi:MAG: contact-dependent growth inhibition system immunity protein [Candidatus Dormibacteria bacterium]
MNSSSDVIDAAARAEHDFPALARFFGGYFHQDWQEEYGSSTAAVAAFVRDAPAAGAAKTAAELDRVLALDLDDPALGRLLYDGFECNYVPQVDELSNRAWLQRVRALLQPPARA